MKIISLQANNIKRLVAVEIHPTGNLVQITGKNGAGKSSVLDAIWMALAGAGVVPSKPVRDGEEQASIRLDLGTLVVTRKFSAKGTTSLAVESQDGAQYKSPQTMLDKLLGALTFDPLAFSRLGPKDQLEQLRTLVSIDEDLDAIDRENSRDYAARTDNNRRAKAVAERVAMYQARVDDSIDITPIETAPLVEALEAGVRHNAGIEAMRAEQANDARHATRCREQADNKRQMAARLLEEAEHMDREAATAAERSRSEVPEPIDTAKLRDEMQAAALENKRREFQAASRRAHAEAAEEYAAHVAETDRLTAAMAERTAQKSAAIARAQMPVDGLSFGAGEVFYRGIPFSQASHAERLRVSVAIAMATNPTLRVLRIEDGSLLDDDNLALIEEMARENDYQVWLERASSDGSIGIHIEGGEVVAIDGHAPLASVA